MHETIESLARSVEALFIAKMCINFLRHEVQHYMLIEPIASNSGVVKGIEPIKLNLCVQRVNQYISGGFRGQRGRQPNPFQHGAVAISTAMAVRGRYSTACLPPFI